MEASAASATPARLPPWRAGRPRRSAAERRAQRSRAHGRVAQALLRCFADLAAHRGCQPSRLGIALGALLVAGGQGASQDPEATAMPAPGVSCAAAGATATPAPAATVEVAECHGPGATALPAPVVSCAAAGATPKLFVVGLPAPAATVEVAECHDPGATALPAPGLSCAAAGAMAWTAPAATMEDAEVEHALRIGPAGDVALGATECTGAGVGAASQVSAEYDQAPRHGPAVAVALVGVETGDNSDHWAWNPVAEVFTPAGAAAFAPCQGEDMEEQGKADVPMPGVDVLAPGWWAKVLSRAERAPLGGAAVLGPQVGPPAVGADWLGFLDLRSVAAAACSWSLARDAVELKKYLRWSSEASSNYVVTPTPGAAGLRHLKGRRLQPMVAYLGK